jgi:hypothetical protein
MRVTAVGLLYRYHSSQCTVLTVPNCTVTDRNNVSVTTITICPHNKQSSKDRYSQYQNMVHGNSTSHNTVTYSTKQWYISSRDKYLRSKLVTNLVKHKNIQNNTIRISAGFFGYNNNNNHQADYENKITQVHSCIGLKSRNLTNNSDIHVTVNRRHSEGKEPTRCDTVCSFIASTCFGHQYVHHQEYN